VDRFPTVAGSKTSPAGKETSPALDGRDESSAEEAQAGASWRKLLGGTPREVLGRLVQDDPLAIREKVAARLQADALLFDADRVHLRVLARISRFAGRYRGRPELSAWIESAVAESVEELLREEHESVRSRRPEVSEKVGVFAVLAPPLGLDPTAMRAACAAFNSLSFADRSAFSDLVLRGNSLDKVARSAGESATEVARRARRALDTILVSALQEHDKERTEGTT